MCLGLRLSGVALRRAGNKEAQKRAQVHRELSVTDGAAPPDMRAGNGINIPRKSRMCS